MSYPNEDDIESLESEELKLKEEDIELKEEQIDLAKKQLALQKWQIIAIYVGLGVALANILLNSINMFLILRR